VRIYELETNKLLNLQDLQDESGVVAAQDIDAKEVFSLVSRGKYESFDEVIVNEETPEELLAKFSKEHLHADDEVRYFLQGESTFDVRGSKDQWIRIEVGPRDFITVPANLYHRFMVREKNVKAIRLFSGKQGWVPIYRDAQESSLPSH
jgi:1,2-dihydroxy-3-keto-5-methylthiopentene dioxygenase